MKHTVCVLHSKRPSKADQVFCGIISGMKNVRNFREYRVKSHSRKTYEKYLIPDEIIKILLSVFVARLQEDGRPRRRQQTSGKQIKKNTICPRSSDPFYVVTY